MTLKKDFFFVIFYFLMRQQDKRKFKNFQKLNFKSLTNE